MRVSKRIKQRLKHVVRYWSPYGEEGEYKERPRKAAVYTSDWCCPTCWFDWGRYYEKRMLYKHQFAYANYHGLLKKYWWKYDIEKDWGSVETSEGGSL